MATRNRVQECITPTQMNLIFNARTFWREMAAWTRIYLRSRFLGIGNVEEVFSRLYQLPDSFGDAFRLIFGDQFATEYTLLLKQHVIILSELISAHMAGNTEETQYQVNRFYQHGYERAKFLAGYNPFWSAAEWRNLIDAYHYLTLEEANTFARDDHRASIDLYERIVAHTHMIGDYFAQGLFNFLVYSPQNSRMQWQTRKPQETRTNGDLCITLTQMNVIYRMRMFWFELTSWIRAYFIVIFEERGGPANISARFNVLFQEYQALFSPFFGSQVTEENMKLVREYIELILSLISAQKEGNEEAIRQITQLINQNINDRAAFFAAINPDFDHQQWKTILTNYTRYTYEEITAYLTGDHSRSLDAYSRLLDISQELGNFLAYEFLYHPANRNANSIFPITAAH